MKKIRDIFAGALIFLMLLLTLLVSVLRTPFDYLSYRGSPFYRDFRRKYRMFLCTRWEYRMYNLVKEKNLPIRYLPRDPQKPEEGGFFLYKRTLILENLMQVRLREEDQRWVFQNTDSDGANTVAIMDHAVARVSEVNSLFGANTASHMLIPIHRRQVAKKDLARMERDTRFLTHSGKDLGDLLEAYIITHPKG